MFFSISCFCQSELLVGSCDDFIGVDVYENIYYLKNNTLYKSNTQNNYCNIKYGTPDQVDISNPLLILTFYNSFNQVILLDNQLNFISEFSIPIGFSYVANAGKDKIWAYDSFNNTLNLFNYKTNKTEAKSLPKITNVKNLKSNLNNALVLKDDQLETYNYIARKIKKEHTYKKLLPLSLNTKYFSKDSKIYTDKNTMFISLGKNITSFEIVNKTCYYFSNGSIYRTQITKK